MTTMNDDLLARLLEKVEHRFYGKYRAFVSDNADPEHRGRLRLRIPSVLGKDVVSGWALPCAPYGGAANQGFFFIPDKGAGVWVEFEAGLLEYPVWVGTFWSKPGGSTEVPAPANNQSPPTSKIIKTKNHTIELEDNSGSEAIKVTDGANSNKVTVDKNGILMQDGHGNKITLKSGEIDIESAKIKLGSGAVDKLVKGDTLKAVLAPWLKLVAAHVHPNGNMGTPTGPPSGLSPVPDLTSALSSTHLVE
jgi:uncharacterized protein involved in type VI secretion and phage assembly